MNKCIYTLKGNCEFNEEHIIPAFLGGIKKLPIGYVSLEANNTFSKLENECAILSYLGMERSFFGPGKRGKNIIPKNVKFEIMNDDTGYFIGFIYNSIPKMVNCISINISKSIVTFHANKDSQAEIAEVYKNIKNVFIDDSKKYIKLNNNNIPTDIIIIGLYYEKIIIGYNSNINSKDVINIINQYISKMNILSFDDLCTCKSQVTVYSSYSINLNQLFRFYAKVAFNVAAYVNGQENIINNCFDEIRDMILHGGSFDKYIILNVNFDLDRILQPFNGFGIDFTKSHFVSLSRVENSYFAIVSFYGLKHAIEIELSNNIENKCELKNETYICDWTNKKEGLLLRDYAIEYCKALDEKDKIRL